MHLKLALNESGQVVSVVEMKPHLYHPDFCALYTLKYVLCKLLMI